MFRGFGSGRANSAPGSSSNVRPQPNGVHGREDGTEADNDATVDPPTERPGSPDVPDAQELRRRAQRVHLRRQADQAERLVRLAHNAEAVLLNTRDVQLQDIIRRSHLEMGQIPGRTIPTSNDATRLVAQMLELANQSLEPRQAAIYLAYAHWDYDRAVVRYMDERFGDNEADSLSDPVGDGEEDSDGEEESDGSEEYDSADNFAEMRRLNKNLSRKGPIKGRPDRSLLEIRLRNPGGRADTIRRYQDVHGEVVDWDSSLRKISRWRSQVFRRALGRVRVGRTKYHHLEKQWLIDAHHDFERRCREAGLEVNWRKMDWPHLAIEFNRQFQGQYLPGDTQPRPARTALSLRNERSRIAEITEMTGLKAKDQN